MSGGCPTCGAQIANPADEPFSELPRCGDPSPFVPGQLCILAKGHTLPHGDGFGETEQWRLSQCGRPGCRDRIDPRWFGTVGETSVQMCDGCGGHAYDVNGNETCRKEQA